MIKILDIENIKISSINNKYGYNSKTKRPYLTKEYKEFKKLITTCAKGKLEPPYVIMVIFEMYIDIDNPVKVIIDGLQKKGVIGDDKDVVACHLFKKRIKKGQLGSIKIYGDTIKNLT